MSITLWVNQGTILSHKSLHELVSLCQSSSFHSPMEDAISLGRNLVQKVARFRAIRPMDLGIKL